MLGVSARDFDGFLSDFAIFFFACQTRDSPGRFASSMRLRLLKMMIFPCFSIPFHDGIYGDGILSVPLWHGRGDSLLISSQSALLAI
jgi:hypothetical protein